jgi:hypothetical protein
MRVTAEPYTVPSERFPAGAVVPAKLVLWLPRTLGIVTGTGTDVAIESAGGNFAER